ncbi:MAG: 3-deoxy-manno-octulosonate cytidylyltransferase [Holosporales bacterium]|jgi:3-deoxy-manno-octulosonate cytidylyltransferase (CMP-KDO synthetase)|nr:3-deoxy-manno-octulosonate cytidylyltransferase [Holosporales bacterium]
MLVAVIIPARLHSSRLPRKVLANIGGKPLIVHVWERALKADIGPVYVACAEEEVAHVVREAGGKVAMTDPNLASGSDRVWAALQEIEQETGSCDYIVNLQGDLPFVKPHLLQQVVSLFDREPDTDIATLAAPIAYKDDHWKLPQVAKIALSFAPCGTYGRALYFSRSPIPYGEGAYAHHMGIYCFKRAALQRFVSLSPSSLEQRESLEQLRALEAGMTIRVKMVDTVPLEVNTPEDLDLVQTAWSAQGSC